MHVTLILMCNINYNNLKFISSEKLKSTNAVENNIFNIHIFSFRLKTIYRANLKLFGSATKVDTRFT